jgi:hypothetical protein
MGRTTVRADAIREDYAQEMRINRRFLDWGVFFVIVGAIPLAVRAGYLTSAQLGDVWRFWPLLLIFAGLGLILSRTPIGWLTGLLTAALLGVMVGSALSVGVGGIGGLPGASCGGSIQGTEFPARSGSFDGPSADVHVELDCGSVDIVTADGTSWSVEGVDKDGGGPAIESDGSSLSVRSPDRARSPFDWFEDRSIWEVRVPAGPTTDLGLNLNAANATTVLDGAHLGSVDVQVNAGRAVVDLGGVAAVSDVDVQGNAAAIELTLPALSLSGDIEVNAGSVGICVPEGVGLRIETGDNPIASYDLDGHGLTHDGSVWITPGYDTAAVRIDLDVQANAGSIKLDPEEGCRG